MKSKDNARVSRSYDGMFLAMVLILLLWDLPGKTGLQSIPAFIGYFLLLWQVPYLLPKKWCWLLQMPLCIGVVGGLMGFIRVQNGGDLGALVPVLNLVGHMVAVEVLYLWAQKRRSRLDTAEGLGVFWPVCTVFMLLFDLWLMAYHLLPPLQDLVTTNGAVFRLLPAIVMLIELYNLLPHRVAEEMAEEGTLFKTMDFGATSIHKDVDQPLISWLRGSLYY